MMKNGLTGWMKKTAAFLTALVMLCGVLPLAGASQEDWNQLEISLSWTDGEGNMYVYPALPVEEVEYSFWLLADPEAPLDGMTLKVSHPMHPEETFMPGDGEVIAVQDAGESMDGTTALPIVGLVDGIPVETYLLYVSTLVDQPILEEMPGEIPEGETFGGEQQPGIDTYESCSFLQVRSSRSTLSSLTLAIRGLLWHGRSSDNRQWRKFCQN